MPWLPEDFVHPLRVELPPHGHLRPMGAADTEIDFPAVMGSRERLWSIYGMAWGWPPATMTQDQDRDDLAHHERDIAANASFLYGLFDDAETELLGCVYVDPPERTGGADAEVSWWVVDGWSVPTPSGRWTSRYPAGRPRTGRCAVPGTSAGTSAGTTGSR